MMGQQSIIIIFALSKVGWGGNLDFATPADDFHIKIKDTKSNQE